MLRKDRFRNHGLWNKFHNNPLIWDTITTTGWSTLGKAIGFLIPFFIAAWFGVTSKTDAFFFAYGLILFLSGIFAPVVETVIVPYITEAKEKNEDINGFLGKILGVSGIGFLLLAIILLSVIKPILSLITNFDLQSLNLIYQMLFEITPIIILLTWTSILSGTLNAYKKFAIPAISPGLRAIANLSVIYAFKDILGVHAIALGYLIGEFFRLAILVGTIQKLKIFKISISLKFNPKLWEFLKTASYQIIGMAIVGLNPFIDKIMASWLGDGSVSVIYYADKLYMAPTTLITGGLIVTLLSHWSSSYHESGALILKKNVEKAIRLIFFTSLSIMLLLILFHQPIVKIAFGRGTFDQTKLPEIGSVWVCYLLGFVPYIVGFPLTRAHIVIKNTSFLMKVFFLNCALKIFLNLIFISYIGIIGISLSSSVISWVSLFLLWKGFNKKIIQNQLS